MAFQAPRRALRLVIARARDLQPGGAGVEHPRRRSQTPVGAFSGGNRQKVFLGRWLYGTPPKVVLLSQPTQGVDVGARTDIAIALQKMADTGITIPRCLLRGGTRSNCSAAAPTYATATTGDERGGRRVERDAPRNSHRQHVSTPACIWDAGHSIFWRATEP